jgi:hypothetical protein
LTGEKFPAGFEASKARRRGSNPPLWLHGSGLGRGKAAIPTVKRASYGAIARRTTDVFDALWRKLEKELPSPDCPDGFPLPLSVRSIERMTRLPGSVSGAYRPFPRFPRSPPLAPPAPPVVARLCSSASQLLWWSVTSRVCSSPATAPRLPDMAARPPCQMRDLPVP